MMTILNFESYFRVKKVDKSREMFLRGQVTELRKATVRWVAKMKIGAYKTQLDLNGIEIGSGSCNCDSRSRTGYCEHGVAMMFALRKELNFYPALTTAKAKLVSTRKELASQVDELNDPDARIYESDKKRFVSTARSILKQAAIKAQKADTRAALADCIETVRQIDEMCTILNENFSDSESLLKETFSLLQQIIANVNDESVIEEVAHDMRVEVLRNYRADEFLFLEWMKLLRPVSNQGNRAQKFQNVIDTLDRIKAEYGGYRFSY